jgi:sugar lactone lactonase YvrE
VDDDQIIFIADMDNHRIVQWGLGATSGQVVAGDNGPGSQLDQLNRPRDVIVDKETDSLIICDAGNRRVMRWSRRSRTSEEIVIKNIDCARLTMDDQRFLYVSDFVKHEVRRYRAGDLNGTVVAGREGKGDRLSQFDQPTYVFVDRDRSVYVSDMNNHRVMKWVIDAKEGIVVAGGQGKGNSTAQLSFPRGIFVDPMGTVYVVDTGNDRVVMYRCNNEMTAQGNVVVGGNGRGQQANQLSNPEGLSFDRHGNLHVADYHNHRIQRFSIEH